MVYHKSVVRRRDGGIISLHHVESMKYPGGEELTIDILKDDLNIVATMASGVDHIISMNAIKKYERLFEDTDNDVLRLAILEKWIYIQNGR